MSFGDIISRRLRLVGLRRADVGAELFPRYARDALNVREALGWDPVPGSYRRARDAKPASYFREHATLRSQKVHAVHHAIC
jgi:hypothetical protein